MTLKSFIPLFVSISSCLGELFTECTSDDQYRISLPYSTANSTLLSAKAGVCTEKDVTYVQDASTFNVTIDIERCKLNTKTYPKPKVQQKALYLANVTNLKVGRRGNGMNYTYLDLDISTECGRQMEYQVTHQYGAISSAGAATPDVGVNETDAILPGHKPAFTFAFKEHTNLFFNETRPTGPRQAGRKSYVSITATNMNVAEHTFTVPSCKMTTTSGREQMLFSSLTEENSFIDLYKDYRVENNKNMFLLSHIFFVLDRNPAARYNLTCTVRVCPKQYKGRHSFIGETCDIIRSCSQRPCYHGTCQDSFATTKVSTATDYTCKCDAGFNGTHCETHVQAGQPCTVNSDCASGDCRSGRCCRVGNDDGCSACDDKGFCTTCDGTETCDSTYCVRGKCIIPRFNTNRDIYASCGSKDISKISYDYYGLDTDGLPMWKTDSEWNRFIRSHGSTWACTNKFNGVFAWMTNCTTDHVPDVNSNSCFESHGYTAPIDGSWADWTPTTSCSSSCGNGTQTFNRACTNPAPQNGGAYCEGQATKIETCNLQECTSVNTTLRSSSFLIGQHGSTQLGYHEITSDFLVSPYGRDLFFQFLRTFDYEFSINGWVNNWCLICTADNLGITTANVPFVTISKEDGTAFVCQEDYRQRTKARFCNHKDHDHPTPTDNENRCQIEFEDRLQIVDENHEHWSWYNNECSSSDYRSIGIFIESLLIPVDGSWTDWTPTTSCSSSCGNGTQTFNRTCTNPAPQNGGADCEGQATKIEKCNLQECTSANACNPQNFNITNTSPNGNSNQIVPMENGVKAWYDRGYIYKDIPDPLLSTSAAPVYLVQSAVGRFAGDIIEVEYTPKNTAGTVYVFVESKRDGGRDGGLGASLPSNGWQQMKWQQMKWNSRTMTIYYKALDGNTGKMTLPALTKMALTGMAIKPCDQ